MNVTDKKTYPIEIITKTNNPLYEQRESGITHSPFHLEIILYNAIKSGNESEVNEAIDHYINHGIVIGRLSDNSLLQTKYWAVACISIAIHYAILGGLDETNAYNLSDTYIQELDHFKTTQECIPYLREKAIELTLLVKHTKINNISSPLIKKCLHYINIHLHDRLTIQEIADALNISRDYLSNLFKKETSCSLHSFIIHEKLEASKLMLLQNMSYEKISYNLAFCSESHYISCFKKEYGITPKIFIVHNS